MARNRLLEPSNVIWLQYLDPRCAVSWVMSNTRRATLVSIELEQYRFWNWYYNARFSPKPDGLHW